MLPWASRLICQQSSRTTNWYPASFMPLVARASAVERTTASFNPLQAYLFQLFQPIGGVLARPLSSVYPAAGMPMAAMMTTARKKVPLLIVLLVLRFRSRGELQPRRSEIVYIEVRSQL